MWIAPPTVIALDAGHVQRLGQNALAGERGITMQEDGQNAAAAFGADARLLGARAAHGYWINRFEMAGIRDEMHGDAAACRREEFARCAEMIFHVAAAENAARIHILETGEDFRGGAADSVDHHVQAAAMAHGYDALVGAEAASGIEDGIEKRNQRGIAF